MAKEIALGGGGSVFSYTPKYQYSLVTMFLSGRRRIYREKMLKQRKFFIFNTQAYLLTGEVVKKNNNNTKSSCKRQANELFSSSLFQFLLHAVPITERVRGRKGSPIV